GSGPVGEHEPLQFQGCAQRRPGTARHAAVALDPDGHREGDPGQGGDAVEPRRARHRLARFPTEIAMLTRRYFLRASAIAMAGVGTTPLWLVRTAAQSGRARKILIAIFQRGAADGLSIVVPFFEKRYYAARPTIAVPIPGRADGAIDLEGRFG